MERRHICNEDTLPGYDALHYSRYFPLPEEVVALRPANKMYEAYNSIHKVYVGETGAERLLEIYNALERESAPDYLDAAGWAVAEAALVSESRSSVERLKFIESAERCWESALGAQDNLDTQMPEGHIEDDQKFRFAVSLAFAPIMKAMIVGNVTDSVRERTFADVLAIAQLAGIQRSLAAKNGSVEGFSQLLGFEHECNALLALLHLNDAKYVPLPSSARAGSGTRHPEQTHDIVIINQHWGKIRKTIPVEIKAKASLGDLKRYDALIVRGKMHLSVTGKYSPEHTRSAYAAYYEGTSTIADDTTVFQVNSTIKQLLILYQHGSRIGRHKSPTTYHETSGLQKAYPEFSFNRASKYAINRKGNGV